MNTRMKKVFGGLAAGAAAIALSACLLPVGNGENLTPDGSEIPDVPPDTNLTFVYDNVISKNGCSSCHSTTGHQSGIALNSLVATKAAFFDTDGSPRTTTKTPTLHPTRRVVPGSLDSSYLWQLVSGEFSLPQKSTAPNERMPPGGGMSSAHKAIIRAWILRGAPRE